MNGDLQTSGITFFDALPHLVRVDQLVTGNARRVRRIQVRGEEESRGGPKRSVGKALQSADMQMIISEIGEDADGGLVVPCGKRLVTGNANMQLPLLQQHLVRAQCVTSGGHVLNAGDSLLR